MPAAALRSVDVFVFSGMYVRVNNNIPVLVVTMSRLMQDFRVVGAACLDVYDIQGRLAATRRHARPAACRRGTSRQWSSAMSRCVVGSDAAYRT